MSNDSVVGQSHRQMGFPGTRPPHQHDIVGGIGELQRRQSGDQVSIDVRGTEVEAGQIPMDRERNSRSFGRLLREHPATDFTLIRPPISRPFGHPLGGGFTG